MPQCHQMSIEPFSSIEELRRVGMGMERTVEQPRVCRICLDDEEENDDSIISPCSCTGTHKYVHQKCMKTWLRKAAKDEIQERREPKQFLCEICKNPIKFTTEKVNRCKPLRKVRRTCRKQGMVYGVGIFLLSFFLAGMIFMMVKVSQLLDTSKPEFYIFIIFVGILPVMLLIHLVLLLHKFFMGEVVRVKEVLSRNQHTAQSQ